MDFGTFTILLAVIIVFFLGVKIVPQQEVWIIERLGKYNKSLEAGLNLIFPFVDRVAYKHTLKERAIDVQEQTAITQDNVTLLLDGILLSTAAILFSVKTTDFCSLTVIAFLTITGAGL